MKLLANNHRVLSARFANVLGMLELEDGKKAESYSVDEEGKVFWLEKCIYSSDREVVDSWAKAQKLVDSGVYVTCGVGDGRQIQSLLENNQQDFRIIVVQKGKSALREIFSKRDCSAWLSDMRVILACGETEMELLSFINEHNWSCIEVIDEVKYAPTYELDSQFYDSTMLSFFKYVQQKHKLDATVSQDRGYWQRTTLENLKQMGGAPDVCVLKEAFKGWPMVLVAAGPSLDEAYDFLKEVRDRVLLVCVNSAYGALVKNGIVPDITVAVDPRDSTDMGYEGYDTADTYLLAPFIVNTRVAERFKGKTFSWSTSNKLVNVFVEHVQGQFPSAIDELGTVASSVPQLAKLLGCSKLCFVGQDLAYGEGLKSHVSDSFYSDLPDVVNRARLLKVEGNKGGEVFTDEKLSLYLKILNQVVAYYSGYIEFINTSTGGAKIQAVPYMEYDEAANWIGKAVNKGQAKEVLSAKLINLVGREKGRDTFILRLKSYVDQLLKLSFCSVEKGFGMGNASEYIVKLIKHISSDDELSAVIFEGHEDLFNGISAQGADNVVSRDDMAQIVDLAYWWSTIVNKQL